MTALPEVFVEIEDVVPQLAHFGFPTVEVVHATLLEGNLARMTCTKLDPPTFKGTTTWGVNVRSFRRQMIPLGWTKRDEKNFSRTVAPDEKRQIVIRSGSKGTGQKNGKPTARAKKQTLSAIAANVQLQLIELPPRSTEKPQPETWFLLVRHARTADGQRRIYSELSLPDGSIRDGRVVGWKTRIILPRLDIDGDGTLQKVPAPTPEIVVPVARRTS